VRRHGPLCRRVEIIEGEVALELLGEVDFQ
jgi:hypothetical protein